MQEETGEDDEKEEAPTKKIRVQAEAPEEEMKTRRNLPLKWKMIRTRQWKEK